jgi:hypothetical protein
MPVSAHCVMTQPEGVWGLAFCQQVKIAGPEPASTAAKATHFMIHVTSQVSSPRLSGINTQIPLTNSPPRLTQRVKAAFDQYTAGRGFLGTLLCPRAGLWHMTQYDTAQCYNWQVPNSHCEHHHEARCQVPHRHYELRYDTKRC